SGFGKDTYIGGEAVFQMNAFGADAEYGHFDTGDGIDASADGYYIDVFWSPTGEGRNYSPSDGSFGATAPIRPLGAGGIGHIMFAARYENLDLSDALFGANRNETSAYTIGATWIPVSHVKFQLNYSSTDVDYALAAPTRFDNTIDAVTFRTQLDW
ncbi:MAG TPA: porin, partial [Caulobacterales bacterium]|nr:porin [Caulobacterales bacterium]